LFNLQMSMRTKIRKQTIRWIATAACLLSTLQPALAQPAVPESQELLNGLKVLFWPKPGSSEVLVKLRIHSGSAFDLAGKTGEMALLGDILFPDPATIDYFSEQMDGKLNVSVTYDSITVTMVGKAEQLNNILEVLRNAILSTQLTPEVVARIRDNRIKMIRDTTVSPATVADRAIASRLFGDFPYGRPSAGSAEDLVRVERGDLMLARERFLNSNNATLAIVGGVSQSRAMRTLKQLFGAWRKSEQIVPSTFRSPKTPESRTLVVNGPSPNTEVRFAVRGVSRSNQDFYAAALLARIVQNRWQALSPELAAKPLFVRSESYTLSGTFVLGVAVNNEAVAGSIAGAKKVIESLTTSPVTAEEVDRAKRDTFSETNPQPRETEPDPWLDMDTYRLASAQDRTSSIQAVTPADIQRVANRLFKDAATATVVVGDAPQLKSALQGHLSFEVLGETTEPPPSPKPPIKPGASDKPS
jgi:zinc protease